MPPEPAVPSTTPTPSVEPPAQLPTTPPPANTLQPPPAAPPVAPAAMTPAITHPTVSPQALPIAAAPAVPYSQPILPTQPSSTPPTTAQSPVSVPGQVVATPVNWTQSNVSAMLPPVPLKAKPGLKWLILGLVVVLLVASGALAYHGLFIAPKQALADYLVKVSMSKTGLFNGTVSSTTSDYKLHVKLNGAYDIKDLTNPKLDLKLDGDLSNGGSTNTLAAATSGSTNGSVKGEILTTDKNLYFKIESVGVLSSFLPVQILKDWYKVPIDSQTTQANKCLSTKKGGSGSFLGNQILTQLPLKNSKRVGLFEKIDGHLVTHFKASLDFAGLKDAVDKANKDLSADCKINLTADDFKDLAVDYDLWTSGGFDRLTVHVTTTTTKAAEKATAELSLDTSAYNKPVTITAPANAKPIEDLISLFFGGTIDESSSADPNTAAGRDLARKNDAGRMVSYLEQYASNNGGVYPATPAAVDSMLTAYDTGASATSNLGNKYALAAACASPITSNTFSAAYAVTATKRDYVLSACLESGGPYQVHPVSSPDSSSSSSAARARDAQRKSDLRAVKNALETYFNDENSYPPGSSYVNLSSALVTAYLPAMPVDPKNTGTYVYTYQATVGPNGAGAKCNTKPCGSYYLQGHLENTADSQKKAGTPDTYEVSGVN